MPPDVQKIYRNARIAFLDKAMQEYDQIVQPYLIYIKSFDATMAIMKKKREAEAMAPVPRTAPYSESERKVIEGEAETVEMDEKGRFF